MVLLERRFFVVLQYLIDTALHAGVIWGWASLRLIFESEFPEFSTKKIALLFTICMAVTGVWLVFVGWIRDNISFGWSRIGTGISTVRTVRSSLFHFIRQYNHQREIQFDKSISKQVRLESLSFKEVTLLRSPKDCLLCYFASTPSIVVLSGSFFDRLFLRPFLKICRKYFFQNSYYNASSNNF